MKPGKPRVVGHFTALDGMMFWKLSGDDAQADHWAFKWP
jgi:hypothetical protein